MDPFIIGLRLFAPVFQACETAYTTIKKSRSFNDRFRGEKALLDAQYVVFESLGRIRRDQLLEPLNEHETTENSRMATIRELLWNAQYHLEACEKVIQDVAKKSEPPKKLKKKRPASIANSSADIADSIAESSGASSFQQLGTAGVQTAPDDAQSLATTETTLPTDATVSEANSQHGDEAKKQDKDSKWLGRKWLPRRFGRRGKKQGDGVLVNNPVNDDSPAIPTGGVRPLAAQAGEAIRPQSQNPSIHVTDPNGAASPPVEPAAIHPQRGADEALFADIAGYIDKLEGHRLKFAENNKNLKQLLKLRPDDNGTGNPTHEAVTRTTALVQKTSTTQHALERLNQSIRFMNPTDAPKRVALKLVTDFEEDSDQLRVSIDYLKLRAKGEYYYFALQIHDDTRDHEISTQYLAETKKTYDHDDQTQPDSTDPDAKALKLERSTYPPSSQTNKAEEFELWGDAVYDQADFSRDIHRLFRNRQQKCKAVETLQNLMRPGCAPAHVPLWQRVELMKLAVGANLFLAGIQGTHHPFTLDRFVYYAGVESGTSSEPNDAEALDQAKAVQQMILEPYLSVGFGQRIKPSSKYRLHRIQELGVLLLQIVGCVAIGIDTEREQRKTRDWADEQYEKLVGAALIPLAQIAKNCVEYSGNGDKSAEVEFLANKFLRLEELAGKTYSQWSAAGSMVPLWLPQANF